MRLSVRAVAVTALLAAGLLPWVLHGTSQSIAQSYAARIDRLSEEGGDFDTDNLISNEQSYLDVIPALQAGGVTGGAYIGVGPDQNFSYIAHIRPAIAFVVDIRRDNLLLHLLFKALFTTARNRAEYLSLLTARPPPERLETWADASLQRIVTYIDQGSASPERIQQINRRIHDTISGFGVPLSAGDFATIDRFHRAFMTAGLSLKFQSRGRAPREVYPTFRDLLTATDRAGHSWNYLASESDYQFVRSLQTRDLVVPVVGDLGGTHALSAIADLMSQRGDKLSAFYISNVETYLYGGKYAQFVENVRKLPHDARSVIIRSTFRASISSSDIQLVDQFLGRDRR